MAAENNSIRPDKDFPALEETLEEARLRYRDEEKRRSAFESKTSVLIAANALIIGISTVFFDDIGVLILIPTGLAIVSSGFCLLVLRLKDYKIPGKKVNHFYAYAAENPAKVRDTLLVSYINAIEHNTRKNENKTKNFKYSYWATISSLVAIFLIIIYNL